MGNGRWKTLLSERRGGRGEWFGALAVFILADEKEEFFVASALAKVAGECGGELGDDVAGGFGMEFDEQGNPIPGTGGRDGADLSDYEGEEE